VVQKELLSITEEECIDYAYNLVINRTYEGYITEIKTIYGQLEGLLNHEIQPAPDEWDRKYGVDFYIEISGSYIGIQIKPVESGKSINDYQWISMHETNHAKFQKKYGGKVFFVFSEKGSGKNKKINNIEVVDEILNEIERLGQ
jgi:hypothetical protein